MLNLLTNLNILLAQTAQEKKMTFLYVTLFVFLCLLLFIDSREKKSLIGNKTLAKIVLFMLILAIVVLVVLYFVL